MTTPAFVWSPGYEADIGAHVFRTAKYRQVRERLLASGTAPPEAFLLPRPRGKPLLELVHSREYLEDLAFLRWTPRTASSELPLTGEIVAWFETAVAGTATATELALVRGAALHVGGGFHHAFADHAEGFCYLNDTAVAARAALGDGGEPPSGRRVHTVSVVDVDVHQGNGTARIFQGDPRVFTFSIHQENNYPMKEESDLDIGLDDHTGDAEYLAELEQGLELSVRKRRPDLVYYVAGADPYREDQLGGLDLTLPGLRERDRRVLTACRETGASVVVVLAGGYALLAEDTVTIHVQTAEEMLRIWPLTP
jgi:acetoin utilization deacetylase AcuC-like enzyme